MGELSKMKPKKQERLNKRKMLLDFIKEKPRQYSELVSEFVKPTSFSESTLKRIREELVILGVIERKHDCWTWCGYKKPWKGTVVMYNVFLNHAKDLIPGFQALAEDYPMGRYQTTDDKKYVSPEQAESLKEFAESHLKTAPSYQPIYRNLLEFRRLKSKHNELYTERVEKMMRALRGKILTPDRFQILEPKKKPSNSWFKKLFPETVHVKRNIPYALGPFDTKKEIFDVLGVHKIVPTCLSQAGTQRKWYVLGPLAVGVGSHKTLKKLDDFIQTKEEMINVSGDLKRDIHMLKLQIEHGQPLDEDSYCKICTNIIIKEEASKKRKIRQGLTKETNQTIKRNKPTSLAFTKSLLG